MPYRAAGYDDTKEEFPSNRLPFFFPPFSVVFFFFFITSSPDPQPGPPSALKDRNKAEA